MSKLIFVDIGREKCDVKFLGKTVGSVTGDELLQAISSAIEAYRRISIRSVLEVDTTVQNDQESESDLKNDRD